MGQTVLMMRENEERMKFLGYNTNISRLILFTFTGAVAGLAGRSTRCTSSSAPVGHQRRHDDDGAAHDLRGRDGTFWGPMLGSWSTSSSRTT